MIEKLLRHESFAEEILAVEYNELESFGKKLVDSNFYTTKDLIEIFNLIFREETKSRDNFRYASILEGYISCVAKIEDEVLNLIAFLYNQKDSFLTHKINNGLEQRFSKLSGVELCKLFELATKEKFDINFFQQVSYAWLKKSETRAADSIIKLVKKENDEYKKSIIYLVGAFKYKTKTNQIRAKKFILSLLESSSEEEKIGAIPAAFRIHENMSGCEEILGKIYLFSESNKSEIIKELIRNLLVMQNFYGLDLKTKIIKSASRYIHIDKEFIGLIDHALYNLDIKNERKEIFEILEAIVVEQKNTSLEDLPLLKSKIESSNEENFSWYAFKFLLSDFHKVRKQVNKIFPPLSEHTKNLSLSGFNISLAFTMYLVHKIFGYLYLNHGPPVSLLAACLESRNETEIGHIERRIIDFWLKNYPSDIELFHSIAQAKKSSKLISSIERMKNAAEIYHEPLRLIPQNTAMRPSIMQRRMQSELKYQREKEIFKASREQSTLASLFKQSTVLYGNSVISYIYTSLDNDPIRQVNKMGRHTTYMTLARMEILHPVHYYFLIRKFIDEEKPS